MIHGDIGVQVGDHVYLDERPVTVVAQRYRQVWYVPGHVEYLSMECEDFRQRGSGW